MSSARAWRSRGRSRSENCSYRARCCAVMSALGGDCGIAVGGWLEKQAIDRLIFRSPGMFIRLATAQEVEVGVALRDRVLDRCQVYELARAQVFERGIEASQIMVDALARRERVHRRDHV